MFSFQNSIEVFYGNILDYVNSEDIYHTYLGYYPKLNEFYHSPFGEDKIPSMRFFIRDGILLFNDFSSDKKGNAVNMVMYLNHCDFKTATNIIANKLKIQNNQVFTNRIIHQEKPPKVIEVSLFKQIPQSFYSYWNQFEITLNILQYFDILPARYVWLNDVLIASYKDSEPLIRYRLNTKYKIYNPLGNPDYKWLSTTSNSDIFALNKLPKKGKILVISKAMKDIMCWAVLGIPSIAMCTEKAMIPEDLMNDLKSRFSKIIVFLDNDKHGIESMLKYHKLYNLECYMLPENSGYKDIADYIKDKGSKQLKQLLKTLKPIKYV